MARELSARAAIPEPRWCGSYSFGHEVHWIQWKQSHRDGLGVQTEIRDVADDGTITFTDGMTRWNHEPERLRIVLAECSGPVRLGSKGVLYVDNHGGAYTFSVNDTPDPCRPETAVDVPGESVADEVLRRGGFSRSAPELAAELQREQRGASE